MLKLLSPSSWRSLLAVCGLFVKKRFFKGIAERFYDKNSFAKRVAGNFRRILRFEGLECRWLMTAVWTGGGTDNKWSDTANWSPAAAPSAGADLDFPSSVSGTSTDNDLSVGTSFNSITFSGSGYTITGNNLVVTSTVSAAADTTNTINVAMMLDGSVNFDVGSGATITDSQTITDAPGGGSLVVTGGGTLSVSGSGSYSGAAIVVSANLIVNGASSLPTGADLVIGDSTVWGVPTLSTPPPTFTRSAPIDALGDYSPSVSTASVDYATGDALLSANDLGLDASTDASGLLAPGTRNYNSGLKGSLGGLGAGWMLSDQPYLTGNANSNVATVVLDANTAYTFVESDGVYSPAGGFVSKETLTADSSDHLFNFTLSDGTVYQFSDLSYSDARAGQFVGEYLPSGAKLVATSLDSAHWNQISALAWYQGGSSTAYQTEAIAYGPDLVNANNVASIILKTWDSDSSALVYQRETDYTYYDGTSTNGPAGTLQSATTWLLNSSGDETTSLGTSYNRYDKYAHLTLALSPQEVVNAVGSFSSATDTLSALESASDSYLEPYAGYQFVYSGIKPLARVADAYLDGGALHYHYYYSYDLNYDQNENSWLVDTEEVAYAGTTTTVYSTNNVFTNLAGQTLLTDLSDGTNHWYTVDQYGTTADQDYGLPTETATSSAIASYDSSDANLDIAFNSSAGQFTRYVYGADTTDDPAPVGYLEKVTLYHGSGDTTGIPQESYTYTTHSGDLSTSTGALAVTLVLVASESDYPDGATANTTSYSYTWYTGSTDSAQVEAETTTLPAVTVAQNGSGTATATKEVYSTSGGLIWQENANGRFTFNTYDSVTGLLTESVADATSYTGSIAPPDTLPTSGVNATTDFSYEDLRRLIQTLGPAFIDAAGDTVRTADESSYLDANEEVRTAQGFEVITPASGGIYSADEFVLANPISIQRGDLDGNLVDDIEAEAGPETTIPDTTLAGLDSLSFSASSTDYPWSRWTHFDYAPSSSGNSATGDLIDKEIFTSISTGIIVEDFYRYDSMNRQDEVLDTDLNITATVFNVLGLATSVSVGTSDGTYWPGESSIVASNMVEITSNVYDDGNGGGDGLLTSQTEYTGTGSRTTLFGYDWRDRDLWTMVNSGTYVTFACNTYDNTNNVIETRTFNNTEDETLAEIDATTDSSDILIADTTTEYDNLGFGYQTTTYGVDPTDGAETSGSISTNYWRDGDGNIIKEQDGGTLGFTKMQYNGLDNPIATYTGIANYDGTANNPEPIGTTGTYAAAESLTGDTILNETITDYDPASDAIFVTNYDRYDNASTTDYVALSSSNARVSYSGSWFDGVGRTVVTADYGSPGTTVTRPDIAPTTSSTVIVNSTVFNARGEVWKTFDAAGNETDNNYDDVGRPVETIQNVSTSVAADTNITTDRTFISGSSFFAYTKATTENADLSGTQTQVTVDVYGTDYDDSSPLVYRNDLVRAVITGLTSTTDLESIVDTIGSGDTLGYKVVFYSYDALGETTQMIDQNGTEHDYGFDGLGDQISDSVTLPSGSSIDDSVLRIDTSFDVRGNVYATTSYSNTDGASDHIVNQVVNEYNTFNELTYQYQSVSGAVDTSSTPYVFYGYADGTSTPTLLVSMTYPNGRELDYIYNTGIDVDVGRVSALEDSGGSTPLVEYKYLGLSTIDDVEYPESGVDNDMGHQTDGILDRVSAYNQAVDQVFAETGGNIDDIKDSYDISGNVLVQTQVTADSDGVYLDEALTYNGLNELTSGTQGKLDEAGTAIDSHAGVAETWTLDGMGNWSNYTQTNAATTVDDQDRQTNSLNEITSYYDSSDTSTSDWATPAYDAAGNMTTIPQPGNESTGMSGVYDAWNRLVEVDAGGTVVTYSYNGLHQRVTSTTGGTTTAFYFSALSQDIEERVGGSSSANVQYVYGLRYVNDIVLRDGATGSGGNLGIEGSGLGQRLYVLQDSNWNVIALVNTSGTVVERYTYTAYGTPTIRNADFSVKSSGTGYGWTMLFAGEYNDATTNLSYNDARWYNTSLGVFTSTDPSQADPNTYSYVSDNPMVGTAPTGTNADVVVDPNAPPPSYDPDPWNKPGTKNSNNCYSYALDQPNLPNGQPRKPGPSGKLQPGGAANIRLNKKDYGNKNNGLNGAALKDPFGVKPLPADGKVPPGYHKIQGFYDPSKGGDYHWYRQDDDGTWSSKGGQGRATNLDADDKPITDPEKANRNYNTKTIQGRNYSERCPVLIAPNRPSDEPNSNESCYFDDDLYWSISFVTFS